MLRRTRVTKHYVRITYICVHKLHLEHILLFMYVYDVYVFYS